MTPHLAVPGFAVGAVVVVAAVVWGVLAHYVFIPRWYLDELYYMETAVSFAQGHGLRFRDDPWGYGPVLPLLLAGVVRLTPDQASAYELAKLVNALLFALASVPVYLLARRLLPPWQSVGVALLAALIPSSVYVSVVMTESLGYLVSCWVVLSIVLTLERPTATRQVAVLGGTLLAILVRPQLVALYGGYLLGLSVVCMLFPAQRDAVRRAPFVLWPTALSLVAGFAWLSRSIVAGNGLGDALGAYSPLASGYDAPLVVAWAARSLGGLALYLAVVPMVVAPVVLRRAWSRARDGGVQDGAFLAAFAGLNVSFLAVTAAFVTTEFGHRILHDRYLFYVSPLWLLAFVVWLHLGLPRPVRTLTAGIVATVVLVLVLPWERIGSDRYFDQFAAVATEVWGKIGVAAESLPIVSTWAVAAAVTVGLAASAALVPVRHGRVLVAVVVVGLAANLAPGWRSAYIDLAAAGMDRSLARTWVDDTIGTRADATLLFLARGCTGAERGAFNATDFFNRSVRSALTVGGEGPAAPRRAVVGPRGVVLLEDGAKIVVPYVVAQRGVELHGRRLAEGTGARLALWRLAGPLRVVGGRSETELLAGGCERA